MGTQPPTSKGANAHPVFGPRLLWPNQTAAWIKMSLRAELGLGLHSIVFGVDPATPRKKDTPIPHPILAHVYCGHGWMDEDAAWYTEVDFGRGQCCAPFAGAGTPASSTNVASGHNCRRTCSSRKQHSSPPSFRPMSIVATVAHLSYCSALVINIASTEWSPTRQRIRTATFLDVCE